MKTKTKQYHCAEAAMAPELLAYLQREPNSTSYPSLKGHRLNLSYIARAGADNFNPMPNVSTRAFITSMLSEHLEQKDKNENGLVPGKCVEFLSKVHTAEVGILIYDIDWFLVLEQVRRVLKRFKRCAHLATSYNHGKTTTKLTSVRSVNDSREVASIGPLSDGDAARYCASIKKLSRLRNVRVAHGGELQFENGESFFLVEHDPVDKCRVYIFLATPIIISEVGHVVYSAIYHALGKELFGGAYDTSCGHANRIFFLPAKPVGCTVAHVSEHYDGTLYDWRELGERISEEVTEQAAEAAARAERFASEGRSVKIADIAEALQHIPPEDYKDWFSALAAIHHETGGSDEGRALAHEWSALSPEQYDPDAVDTRWDTFTESDFVGRKATFGTLVHLARKFYADFRRKFKNPSSDDIPPPTPTPGWRNHLNK